MKVTRGRIVARGAVARVDIRLVFVYLFICICLFVYLYLCICVSVFTEVFIPQGFLSRVHPSIYPFVRTVYFLQQPLVWRQNRFLQRNLWISRPSTTHMVFHVYNVFVNIIKLSWLPFFHFPKHVMLYKRRKSATFPFYKSPKLASVAFQRKSKEGGGIRHCLVQFVYFTIVCFIFYI